MTLRKPKFKCKQALTLALVGAGASLFLTPSVRASSAPASSTATNPPIMLAQSNTGCPEGQSTFVEAETRNFFVYICGGDLPGSYVGIAKNGSGKVTAPLESYDRDRFVAVNNRTRYNLTRNRLVATKRGRIIVSESIRRWN